MTIEVGDIEIDIYPTPNGWAYWFVSPYGNIVTRRDKTSEHHALNAARLALKYYTELPSRSGKVAGIVLPEEELKRSIATRDENLAYCTKYFDGVLAHRAIESWALHNIHRILHNNLDPLPLPEAMRPYLQSGIDYHSQ